MRGRMLQQEMAVATLQCTAPSGGRALEVMYTQFLSKFSGDLATNARALRSLREYADAPPPGILRVAAFGDSFVHGDEVDDVSNWAALIDVFCVKHASVIDTRRIPGHDGLAELGDKQNDFIAIDEPLFRSYLAHPIAR